MRPENLEQLFSFRSKCLCGNPFYSSFVYSTFTDGLISIMPLAAYKVDEKTNTISFSFNFKSHVSPHIDIDFVLVVAAKTSNFACHLNRDTSTNYDVIKKKITPYTLKELNIKMCLTCYAHNSTNSTCNKSYHLNSTPLLFDFETMKVTTQAIDEHFKLHLKNNTYRVHTDFEKNTTTFSEVEGSLSGYSYYSKDILSIEADKFLRIPFEEAILVEKLKTYLIFS